MTVLAIFYVAASSVLTAHTVFQFWLFIAARRRRFRRQRLEAGTTLPFVTVQLPIYNERFVVKRLLAAVAGLDYPRDRLRIQVLDDSTDDTTTLVAAQCAGLVAEGVPIEHVRRGVRTGFKAGALQYGLEHTQGELIAVFDADFIPPPNLLRLMVPHFADAHVAAVQARWAYANRDESLLTRMQAFYIDVHFGVEQAGRSELECFVNFNGTAGIWRASAIHDAGGWTADTLTEDLDLSYRSQLRGWKIVFLDEVEVASELPGDVRAFRAQQYRWMKGVAQNATKLAPSIVRSLLPRRVKAHALAHLLESTTFVALWCVLALTPVAAYGVRIGSLSIWTTLNPLWIANFCLLAPVYFAPRRERGLRGVAGGLGLWLVFVAVSLGMSLHNTVAVISGLLQRGGTFVRTPKQGDGPAIASGPYHVAGIDRVFVLELIFWSYLGAALIWGAVSGTLHLLWVPLLGFVGLSGLLFGSVRRLRARGATSRYPSPHPAADHSCRPSP